MDGGLVVHGLTGFLQFSDSEHSIFPIMLHFWSQINEFTLVYQSYMAGKPEFDGRLFGICGQALAWTWESMMVVVIYHQPAP
jgi:hypothetical protein